MEPIIAIAVGTGFFLLLLIVVPRFVTADASKRTRGIIEKIAAGASESTGEAPAAPKDDDQVIASFRSEATGLAKLFLMIPGSEEFYLLMVKAGFAQRTQAVILGMAGLFLFLTLIFAKVFGIFGVVIGAVLSWFIAKKYFRREIRKRNIKFIDMFPEAIDMIVRSVKSGHPLNTALRMIADNLEAPIGPEFRQVVNEISYGRPMVEALRRLAKRIDEQDIHFFVVVLSVQQETGGNLAEILGNLSNVIRGRKRLNQKIRAMTAEGRATAWVLGSLPVVQIGAIQLTSPDYLLPLFNTFQGNIVLAFAIGLIGLAMWIVNQMIQIDV